MPVLGKPEFNYNAPCLEQDYILWDNTLKDNFIIHERKRAHGANYVRCLMGDIL